MLFLVRIMAELNFLVMVLAVLSVLLLVVLLVLWRKNSELSEALSAVSFSKSSQSVKYGKMAEHFIPFSQKFPYSPNQFRFIGNPVDGVVFGDQKIVFVEFKTASSQLNGNQKKVKKLVEDKKVEWLEFRMN